MAYGAEIWGWAEKKELEKIQLDYYRWILRLDFCTPRYLIEKETDIERMCLDWAMRALNYEQTIVKLEEGRLIKICWRKKQKGMIGDSYSIEREEFLSTLGFTSIHAAMKWWNNENVNAELKERFRDIRKQRTESSITNTKYNKNYKNISSSVYPYI